MTDEASGGIRVPYGRSTVTARLPAHIGIDVIEMVDPPAAADPIAAVARALDAPLGDFSWSKHKSVAIAVSDKTRPVPHQHLLPPLIDRLGGLGIPDEAVTFYIAVGTHPPMSPDEHPAILPPEVLRRFRVISHDCERDDLVFLGETSRGNPVRVNRSYVEASFKVVVGTIEPHQFAGFSGGVKGAAIGLAGLETINGNHALMAHPDAQIGTYATNPVRQDIEEIGRMMGIDLALNVIVDGQRRIVQALAGEPVAVMEAGHPLARRFRQVAVPQDYELVVTSPGGHPRDINVYQSQKAVASAASIVRPGGTMILAAACPEGSGSQSYEEWVSTKQSRREVLDAYLAEGFRIGPHKAFQLARDTAQARLVVCSDMPDELSRRLLLDPADNFQAAVDTALADLTPGERIAVLPRGTSTIPYLEMP